jgi:hypothetical protein
MPITKNKVVGEEYRTLGSRDYNDIPHTASASDRWAYRGEGVSELLYTRQTQDTYQAAILDTGNTGADMNGFRRFGSAKSYDLERALRQALPTNPQRRPEKIRLLKSEEEWIILLSP